MATQMQKDNEGKKTIVVTEQEQPEVDNGTPAGPFIRVTYGGQRHDIMGGSMDIDVLTSSDRDVISAIQRELGERLSKTVSLRDYKIARLANGNWLVSPPAVYG